MSDSNATGDAAPRPKQDEVIEEAVVVDDGVIVEDAAGTPVVAEEVVEVEPVAPSERVVYVHVPTAPRKLSNRPLGTVVALIATVVFTVILAVITALVGVANGRPASFAFLARADFYIPSLFFLIAFVLLVLIVNRGNWWAFIVGSLVVGVVVYFGTIGLTLLGAGVVQQTPAEAAVSFRLLMGNPFVIGSALLAREVALWSGGIISKRGRRLRARNHENREAYERELATTRAEHERAAAASATA